MSKSKKKSCSAPGGKCANPKACAQLNLGKGGCIMAKKGVKPGQVTGKSGGY